MISGQSEEESVLLKNIYHLPNTFRDSLMMNIVGSYVVAWPLHDLRQTDVPV